MGIFDKWRSKPKTKIPEGIKTNFLTCTSRTDITNNPEVRTAINNIGDLLSIAKLKLYERTEDGNKEVKNGLIDLINKKPFKYFNKTQFIKWIIENLFLYGNCILYPRTKDGYLVELQPIAHSNYRLINDIFTGYKIVIDDKAYSPDEFIHIKINTKINSPYEGEGYERMIGDLIKQIDYTKSRKLKLANQQLHPNLIIGVEGMNDELTTKEGRQSVIDAFIGQDGEVNNILLLPSSLMTVKEMSTRGITESGLQDMEDGFKKNIGDILGVPSFILGVGEFKKDVYNNFINTRLKALAENIAQELTDKLMISNNYYFEFDLTDLLHIDYMDKINATINLYSKGLIKRDEARTHFNLEPTDNLEGFVMLENYIPMELIDKQTKLNGKEDESDGDKNTETTD